MSGLARRLMAGVGAAEKLYVDDVFSTYLYTGNGAAQTINNGIDLAGKGGLVWLKARSGGPNSGADNNLLFCTANGANDYVSSNNNQPENWAGVSSQLNFTGSGFSVSATGINGVNSTGTNTASWTFRNADKFYNHGVVTKTAGSNATISFANLGALGMVRVKRTDAAGSWYVWHRSLSAGQLLIGETAAAAATLGQATVSGTTVTLVNGVIADGTYLVEAFAHDASADGIIQCGSFTTDGSGNATANLGWEPQLVITKAHNGASNWQMQDIMRGLVVTNGNSAGLFANISNAEAVGVNWANITNTGFGFSLSGLPSTTFIYLAIRRPDKPPTTGTQVYNAIARTGTGAAATVTGVGFAPDYIFSAQRDRTASTVNGVYDRLRGTNAGWLSTDGTGTETYIATDITALLQDGYVVDTSARFNGSGKGYINHFFKRAPGFMDVVCYTGTGSSDRMVDHGLSAIPEFVLIKQRNGTGNWYGYTSAAANKYFVLNTTVAFANSTGFIASPTGNTSSQFRLDTSGNLGINTNLQTYVAYLFATKAGISKVGSYTGNGSSQTIACGFSAGSRFVLIKRTDNTGDWYIWDSVRGIVAANDPHLSLNTTAAEVTTDDSIDPDASGFVVNQNAATNINVTSASYIFLAIA